MHAQKKVQEAQQEFKQVVIETGKAKDKVQLLRDDDEQLEDDFDDLQQTPDNTDK